MHPYRVIVWCILRSGRFIVPFFFKKRGDRDMINQAFVFQLEAIALEDNINGLFLIVRFSE